MQAQAAQPLGAFDQQVVLITGAGRGLGCRLAQAFAQQGAIVAANDLTPINVNPCFEQIKQAGGRGGVFLADIASKLAIQSMLHEILDTWGRIDILINHAQVRPQVPLLEIDEWDWRRTVDVNLNAAFLLIQSVAREMRTAGGGQIINLAPLSGPGAFLASKIGLAGLTRPAALEFEAYNIRINTVCPIEQATPGLDPLPAGLALPADSVDLVLHLCSPAAADINGRLIGIISDQN